MSNVSLLGSAGGTITLPITSADNAVMAQSALAGITDAVAAGTLREIVQSSTELASTTVSTVVVLQAEGALPPLQLGNGYVAAVLDGPQLQGVVSGVTPNETIISGTSGAIVDNLAHNTQVFFGGGNNSFVEAGGPGFDPSASVWLDGDAYLDLSTGETTVFAGAAAAIDVVNNGNGTNRIDFRATDPSGPDNLIAIGGISDNAATVNAAGAGLVALQDGGAAVINANRSNVTIHGAPSAGWHGGGSVTLYGGTGRDFVDGGSGYFQGGTVGGNRLSSSTVPGAATLVGGGAGDTLTANGSGDVLFAGPGNETLIGSGAPMIALGYAGVQPANAITSMVGSGGDVFYIGKGQTYITANHGGGGSLFAKSTNGSDKAVITGFISGEDPVGAPQSGADRISLWWSGGKYLLVGNTAPQPGEVSYSYTMIGTTPASEIRFGDGATWTLMNTLVHPGDFV